MALQYQVKTDVPKQLRDRGFVAYVTDAHHPDGPDCSISWHLDLHDAQRTAHALNLCVGDLRQLRADSRCESLA